MRSQKFLVLASLAFAVMFGSSTPWRMQAQDNSTPYPIKMAPRDQYLMDRNAEIALVRSAPPSSVAKDATVMVLGRHGYETAVEGTNGFVCNVDRSWMDQFENCPEFWNPKRRGPVCIQPAGCQDAAADHFD